MTSWKGPLLWVILIVVALLPLGATVDVVKFTILLLIILLMPPAIVIAGIFKANRKVAKGLRFMLALTIIEFASLGIWIGGILFGIGLAALAFGFLIAGIFAKILDRMMKPRKQRALLNFQTLMQSRLWWLLLAVVWLVFLKWLGYIANSIVPVPTEQLVGRFLFFVVLVLTVAILILKYIGKPKRKPLTGDG